ncbi:MAG: hydantoinase B/oxoprolinase family protein, partial [Planctomycetota bacterium]
AAAGAARGGEGLLKELEFLAPARVTVLATRRNSAPGGAAGGAPGRPGRDQVRLKGRWRRLHPGESVDLEPGDRVRIETPGGGGFGTSLKCGLRT